MFSRALRYSTNAKFWNTKPMAPTRNARRALSPNRVTCVPSTVIRPAPAVRMPATRFSSVVLPVPEGPTTATLSPFATLRSGISSRKPPAGWAKRRPSISIIEPLT